ncbi:hypothetical protein CQA66_06745 [Helicobacter aurati]|uniref:Uncharacterized protein n=1 Tax=Helicobacter aurati TaxID=137778 RepID=A0A3D8J176_9HELI|nr:hypothetical protein [Helicobacter aurati]RDU71238.1 hypothetical protein CQA66_06745 [Helicobacter aurati]
MTVDNNTPVVEKLPVVKDSLKFAGTQKTFSIIDTVPDSMHNSESQGEQHSNQVSEMLSTIKALQIAKKSLSDAQSIVKDIKSNYKVESNDEWSILDNKMLQQRYNAMQEIKKIFDNAQYNHKNVFKINYTDKNIHLDLDKNNLKNLNLRDGHSIDIFSYNIDSLSKQIDKEIKNLQDKIDSINQARWISTQQLKNIPLEQKDIKANTSNNTPNLASLLTLENNPESPTTNTADLQTPKTAELLITNNEANTPLADSEEKNTISNNENETKNNEESPDLQTNIQQTAADNPNETEPPNSQATNTQPTDNPENDASINNQNIS